MGVWGQTWFRERAGHVTVGSPFPSPKTPYPCLPGIEEVHDKIARMKAGRAQYTPSLLQKKNSGAHGPGIHKIPGSKCIL